VGLVCAALSVYWGILIVRILLSWVTAFSAWSPPPALAPVVGVIFDLTEPVMAFFRRYIPPVGGLDLSPIIIFLILGAVRGSLC
jgi:YggT family protein